MKAPEPSGPTEQGRRAVRNILWSTWGQISVAVFGVIWLFTIPRTLGPEHYGLFVLLSSLTDFHTMGCTLGIQHSFAYYFPLLQRHDPRQLHRLTTSYGLVVMGVSLPAALLVAWLGLRLGGSNITVFLAGLAALAALFQSANSIFSAILYGENRIGIYSMRFPLQQFVSTAAVFAGAWYYGLNGSMTGQVAGTALVVIWLFAVARPWRYLAPARPVALPEPEQPADHAPLPARLLPQALLFGLYSLFGTLAALTITRGGNIILAGVGRSSEEIAVFAVGLGFVLQGAVLLSAFGTALTPGIAGLVSSGETDRAHDWVGRAAKYQALAALAAVGFVLFLGEDLLNAAVGSRFPGVYTITAVGAFALIPMSQTTLANQMAIAWGRPRLNLEAWILMSLLFLTSAAIAGALTGPLGAAAALLGTAWLTTGYVNWRLRADNGPLLWPWPVVKLLLLACPAFAAILLRDSLLHNFLLYLGFLAYLFLAGVLSKSLHPAEIKEIIIALRNRSAS